VLLVLSMILLVTTMFPHIDVTGLGAGLGGALVVAFAGAGVVALFRRRGRAREPVKSVLEGRKNWRMPPLALLDRPVWSTGRRVAMYSLRSYLVVAAVLLLVKTIQLGTAGH
jgi:NAD(P)-dependent dehydrogenase (short-subunit alcohol dehydrogenase family)